MRVWTAQAGRSAARPWAMLCAEQAAAAAVPAQQNTLGCAASNVQCCAVLPSVEVQLLLNRCKLLDSGLQC